MDISWTTPFTIIGFLFVAGLISLCLGYVDNERWRPSASTCSKCQNKLNITSKFCERCGAKA